MNIREGSLGGLGVLARECNIQVKPDAWELGIGIDVFNFLSRDHLITPIT